MRVNLFTPRDLERISRIFDETDLTYENAGWFWMIWLRISMILRPDMWKAGLQFATTDPAIYKFQNKKEKELIDKINFDIVAGDFISLIKKLLSFIPGIPDWINTIVEATEQPQTEKSDDDWFF